MATWFSYNLLLIFVIPHDCIIHQTVFATKLHCASDVGEENSNVNVLSSACLEETHHCLVLLILKDEESATNQSDFIKYNYYGHGCWTWSELTDHCPNEPGVCHITHIMDDKTHGTCCCYGYMCNNSTLEFVDVSDHPKLQDLALRNNEITSELLGIRRLHQPVQYVLIILGCFAGFVGLGIIGMFYLLCCSSKFRRKSSTPCTQTVYTQPVSETALPYRLSRWCFCCPLLFKGHRYHYSSITTCAKDVPLSGDARAVNTNRSRQTHLSSSSCAVTNDHPYQRDRCSALPNHDSNTLEYLVNQYIVQQCVKDRCIDSGRFAQVWLAHLPQELVNNPLEVLLKSDFRSNSVRQDAPTTDSGCTSQEKLHQRLKSLLQNGTLCHNDFQRPSPTSTHLSTSGDGLEQVALKVFSPVHAKTWNTELNVLRALQFNYTNGFPPSRSTPSTQSSDLRNVQCYFNMYFIRMIGFGMLEDPCTGLIKEYHLLLQFASNGNLSHRLSQGDWIPFKHVLDWGEDITKGLAYLHNEVALNSVTNDLPFPTLSQPADWKPSIAHRDLKPQNILIRADGSACLSDFGQAIVLDTCLSGSESVTLTDSALPPNTLSTVLSVDTPVESMPKAGTLRYMAPEVLDGAIHYSGVSLLRTDIYPLGLILWELLSAIPPGRHTTENLEKAALIPNYQLVKRKHWLPYQKELGYQCSSPTTLQQWVCVEKRRPMHDPVWLENVLYSQLYRTIAECWDPDPEARLPANCVLERMLSLKVALAAEQNDPPITPTSQ